jgi:hypothetical protein
MVIASVNMSSAGEYHIIFNGSLVNNCTLYNADFTTYQPMYSPVIKIYFIIYIFIIVCLNGCFKTYDKCSTLLILSLISVWREFIFSTCMSIFLFDETLYTPNTFIIKYLDKNMCHPTLKQLHV